MQRGLGGQYGEGSASRTGRSRLTMPCPKDAMTSYAAPPPGDAGVAALRAAVAAVVAVRPARRRHAAVGVVVRTGGPGDAGAGAVRDGALPAGPPMDAAAPDGRADAGARTLRDGAVSTTTVGAGAIGGAAGPNGRGPARPPAPPGSGPAEETWRLVTAAQAGDAEAFGRLYDRYVGLVFRYAHHRLGDRALAEDVTSETFLRALRRIGSLSWQGRDVGAWFVTIARNLVIDHLKSGRHRLEVVTGDLSDADRATEGPEPAVLRQISNTELLRCVRKLADEQQECIVLRFLQGLSVAETAQIMGKSEGAIKALQHRAVRRLAALLPEGVR
jgi:RNA polymerase sigma-70 factor (ECF subfamily)